MNRTYIMLKDIPVLEIEDYTCRILNECGKERLLELADQNYIDNIYGNGEKVVKCKIISSEERSLVPWEDFQVYCSWHDKNEYEWIREHDPVNYYSMQVADYILGNEDRHGANFGFFMDNYTGELLGLYPLMDHGHAFSNDEMIPSQTSEQDETLWQAAVRAIPFVDISFNIFLQKNEKEILRMIERENMTAEESLLQEIVLEITEKLERVSWIIEYLGMEIVEEGVLSCDHNTNILLNEKKLPVMREIEVYVYDKALKLINFFKFN